MSLLISFFTSLYSFKTISTKPNSSWLIYESIKDLENETFVLFNLVVANNTVLSYFFFSYLLTQTEIYPVTEETEIRKHSM